MKAPYLSLTLALACSMSLLSACGHSNSSTNAATNAAATEAATQAAAPMAMATVAAAANGAVPNGAVPNCGAVTAVWVNLKTRVYHEPSDPAYGKTKRGEYLCPAQAKAEGYHPAGRRRRR